MTTITGKRLKRELEAKTAQVLADHMADLLRAAHARKLRDLNCFPWVNFGWVVTEDAYLSKTQIGIVKTVRVGPRKYEHSIARA